MNTEYMFDAGQLFAIQISQTYGFYVSFIRRDNDRSYFLISKANK